MNYPKNSRPNTRITKESDGVYEDIDEQSLIASIGSKSTNSRVTTSNHPEPTIKKKTTVSTPDSIAYFFQKRKSGETVKAIISNDHKKKIKTIILATDQGTTTISDYLYNIIEAHFETHREVLKQLIKNADTFNKL
jgi:hypothetical protein